MVACAPVGIEDGRSVSAEKGDDIRDLALLAQRNYGEGASAAGFPIDGEVFGVGLGDRVR